MNKIYLLLLVLLIFFSPRAAAQDREFSGPVFVDSAAAVNATSISKSKVIPPSKKFKVVNFRNRGINKIVPGKGLPKTEDAARQEKMGSIPGKAPIMSFDVAETNFNPSDPTGASGPDHYVNAWNSAFAIYDKMGNQLVPPASLSSIGGEFAGENDGDPIVMYDEFADRFIIMQFFFDPNSNPLLPPVAPFGLLIAVSQGSDPVSSGWYTYRFTMPAFPDYPKISVWSDGYYITTNKNSRTAESSEVVYVVERDRMLAGQAAQIVGFPLPGINTSGFYSPAGFHAIGDQLPPPGNSPILYLQDDAWAGVAEDHLKLWTINVNWASAGDSTIEESQELGAADGVTPFISTFDGGDFSNLPQPGDGDFPDLDALQGAIMHMTSYRRFPTHNSVVLNFVVDVDASAAEHAGIRWYELRQEPNGGPWRINQEGTYAPTGSDRWCGSIGMDRYGNIGMGFTIMDDNPNKPIYPSLRYTGRYAGDPLGVMTVEEVSIMAGTSNSPDRFGRYGDYAHLTIDPADGATFWHNGEYFQGIQRKNRVGVFKLAPDFNNDVGVTAVVEPVDASLTNSEEITVTIRNFGANTQTNFPVSYTVNDGETITETFTGSIPASSSENYTFSTTADLGEVNGIYEITAYTNLAIDQEEDNNSFTVNVLNLFPVDVGVSSIVEPSNGLSLSSSEEVTIVIENFGGEPQSNIPVGYRLENNPLITEVFPGTVAVGKRAEYTFSQRANLSAFGRFMVYAETNLEADGDRSNDSKTKSVGNLNCIPEGSDCSLGDGIFSFELGDIINDNIPCTTGYIDFIDFSTDLDRSEGLFTARVKTLFTSGDDEQLSMWIDFNDNGVFDDEERVISNEILSGAGEWHSVEFSIPANASLGQHIMRVRAGDVSFGGEINDPCSVMDYGTTHDYSVRVVDSTLDLEDFLLNDASLEIVTGENGMFTAFLETTFDRPLRITIHNILGQKLLENQVDNNGQGYLYDFDMSFAARGVYLLRMGTREVGVVKRFIVK